MSAKEPSTRAISIEGLGSVDDIRQALLNALEV
jgi:hypothetical protein